MHYKRAFAVLNLMALIRSSPVHAHASEQGFVLLLPTDLYTGAGVVAVFLTLLILMIVPGRVVDRVFRPVPFGRPRLARVKAVTTMVSSILVLVLIWVGFNGPSDPLANPLVLMVWVVFWIALVSIQGFVGDIWSFISPFSGALRLARWSFGSWRFAPLSPRIGYWPAVIGFLLFGFVLLADPAPADPRHLARVVAGYTVFQMGFILVYGPRWLLRGEVFTVLMRTYGKASILGRGAVGAPGWQIVLGARVPLAVAILCVLLLGTGSFDGLNETFWWMGQLGMNPLEFSGRSAVVVQNTVGMVLANAGLLVIFTVTLFLGLRLASHDLAIPAAFKLFAPTLLPIALGYHIAHYLPSFLVDSQYALVALSDPLMNGSDWLGLGEFYVTTGFFNAKDSVRTIYLTQAGAVVIGHILAVLTAHCVALRVFKSHKKAVLSQVPLAVFMVIYTFFGLWLLASPRF